MKKVVVQGGKEYLVTNEQGQIVSDLMLDRKRSQQAIEIDGDMFRVSTIKGVYRAGANPNHDESLAEKIRREFLQDLETCKTQSVEEKVRRDFYSRFGGLLIVRYGLEAIFGTEYTDRLRTETGKHFADSHWSHKINIDDQIFRQQKIDEFIVAHPKKNEWLAIKNSMRKFYAQNIGAVWMPFEMNATFDRHL